MKTLFYSLILFYSVSDLSAQLIRFSKIYQTPYYEDARYMASSGDGGYVITGLDKSNIDSSGDMYAMKINAAGAIEWKYYYGKPKEDGGNFILKTKDNGFLISGHSNNTPDDECDGYLVKINRDGQREWELFIGTIRDDVCLGAVESEDGNFYLTGRYEEESGNHQFDFLLCKVSSSGKLIWLKHIERNQSEEGNRIVLGSDHTLIIGGYSTDPISKIENTLIIKTDLDGNQIWQQTWPSALHERILLLIALEDGSCIAGGGAAALPFVNNCDHMILKKIDKSGNTTAQVNEQVAPGDHSYLFDGIKLSANQIAFCGIYSDKQKPFILLSDINLNQIAISLCGDDEYRRPLSISKIDSAQIIVCGKEFKSLSDYNIWISRIPIRNDAVSNAVNLDQQDFLLFPNPWNENLYIYTNYTAPKKIMVYQLNGKCIFEKNYSGTDLFINHDDIMDSGFYIYTIQNQEAQLIQSGRFIKE